MLIQQTAIVEEVRFRNPHGVGSGQSVLQIRFTAPDGSVRIHEVPNGNFTIENPALQFLAAIGLKPSDIDGTSYKPPSTVEVPVVADGDGYVITQQPFTYGKQELEKARWIPSGES